MTQFTAPLTRREKALGWVYFAFMQTLLPALIQAGFLLAGKAGNMMQINCIYFAVNFLAVILIFRDYLKKNLKNAGNHLGRFLLTVLVGFVGYRLVAVGIGRLYAMLYPSFANMNDAAIDQMADGHFFLVAFCVVFLVPTAEECFYRGLLFRGIYGKRPWAAYLVSTAIFACIHVSGYVGRGDWLTLILSFLQYVPAGLCLAWTYRFSNSVFAPILIHSAINLLGMLPLR